MSLAQNAATVVNLFWEASIADDGLYSDEFHDAIVALSNSLSGQERALLVEPPTTFGVVVGSFRVILSRSHYGWLAEGVDQDICGEGLTKRDALKEAWMALGTSLLENRDTTKATSDTERWETSKRVSLEDL